MGAFAGSLNYTSYRLDRPMPSAWRSRFVKKAQAQLAKEVTPEDEADQHIGWCNARSPFDTQLTEEKLVFGEYLVLGFRVDQLSVPGALLKLHCEREAKKLAHQLKKESLSRYELAELRETVQRKLRHRVLPTLKNIEVVLHSGNGVLRFFSTSKNMNELFMSLFEETFSVLLIPDTVFTLAHSAALGLDEEALRGLDRVEAEPFTALIEERGEG
ncbi:MAG: recombination-associated protein RdgC [Myxococcota bacterium]|nr:recombination-associated protein RdgC [Myxococcota bacterium]